FLIFVVLDHLGLRGGGPAAWMCVLVGASAPVYVAVTLRALAAEHLARAALPFLVLFPGAVWVGVSADGMFTVVVAPGLARRAIWGGWGRAGWAVRGRGGVACVTTSTCLVVGSAGALWRRGCGVGPPPTAVARWWPRARVRRR